MGLTVVPGQLRQQRFSVNYGDTATRRSRIQRKDFHGYLILSLWIDDDDRSFPAADRRSLDTGF
jgi:hypothetical protein